MKHFFFCERSIAHASLEIFAVILSKIFLGNSYFKRFLIYVKLYLQYRRKLPMKAYLTEEQIIERIKAYCRPPKYLTREQIRQRVQELATTNRPRKSKNAVWG